MIFIDNKTLRKCAKEDIPVSSVFASGKPRSSPLRKVTVISKSYSEDYIFKRAIFCTTEEERSIIVLMMKFYPNTPFPKSRI